MTVPPDSVRPWWRWGLVPLPALAVIAAHYAPPGPLPAVEAVTVTPPSSTGLAPFPLGPGSGAAPVAIPSGSVVGMALRGGWGKADLTVDGRSVAVADSGGRIAATIVGGNRLALRWAWGYPLAEWPIRVVPDTPPSADFTERPAVGEHGLLHLAAAASDDYGLTRLWVEISRPDAPEQAVHQVPLAESSSSPRRLEQSGWYDLTAHPWAGLVVNLRVMAEDSAGQIAGSQPVNLELPERAFSDPVARAIIAQRRRVGDDRTQSRAALDALDDISSRPEAFRDDATVFLALRVARHLLEEGDFDLEAVQDLLWNAALRLDADYAASPQ